MTGKGLNKSLRVENKGNLSTPFVHITHNPKANTHQQREQNEQIENTKKWRTQLLNVPFVDLN